MRKNISPIRLAMRPVGPIRVLDVYERWFHERLREAIRADRERFDYGLPTYHRNLVRTVADHASEQVSPEDLGLKDLENFLKGRRSHLPRIQILDAYLQVVNPEARARCFPENYITSVGTAVADYLKAPSFTRYDRELLMKRLLGAYQVRQTEMDTWKNPPRFVVVSRASVADFLLLYMFNGPRAGQSEPDQLQLRAGLCVPQTTSFLFLMKEYMLKRRYVGSLHFTADPLSPDPLASISISSLVARERALDVQEGDYEDAISDFMGSDREPSRRAERISDAKTITYLMNVVDNFSGVL